MINCTSYMLRMQKMDLQSSRFRKQGEGGSAQLDCSVGFQPDKKKKKKKTEKNKTKKQPLQYAKPSYAYEV